MPRMLTEPEVLAASPVVLSVADALKPNDPVAPLGEINESVVDTLDPGDSEEEAGLNDEAQPLGTVAENIIGEGAQPAPLLLVTVIVYWNVELAGPLWAKGESDTNGAAVTHGSVSSVTWISAPSRVVEIVVILRPNVASVNVWPTSSVESHVVVVGARSIW